MLYLCKLIFVQSLGWKNSDCPLKIGRIWQSSCLQGFLTIFHCIIGGSSELAMLFNTYPLRKDIGYKHNEYECYRPLIFLLVYYFIKLKNKYHCRVFKCSGVICANLWEACVYADKDPSSPGLILVPKRCVTIHAIMKISSCVRITPRWLATFGIFVAQWPFCTYLYLKDPHYF